MSLIAIIKAAVSFILAIVPAGVWGYIFYKKQHGQKSMTLRTFLAGAFAVIPLLLYKALWQYFPWINAFEYTHTFKDDLIGFSNFTLIPLSVITTFLIVGVIEEVAKFFAMKFSDKGKFLSIDDAMESAISAALGFAFLENIIYFYSIMVSRGPENILLPFIFRSLFSTFGHIMFSGILGYYYGLAHFAGPLLQDKHFKKRWPFFRMLVKVFHLEKVVSFKEEKMLQGIIIAVVLHALFNIFLEMNWIFMLFPYVTIGYISLNYLLEKKEDHKMYGLLQARKDFVQPSKKEEKQQNFVQNKFSGQMIE